MCKDLFKTQPKGDKRFIFPEIPVVSSCSPTSKANLSVDDREVDRQHRYCAQTQYPQSMRVFIRNMKEQKVTGGEGDVMREF